MPVSVRVFRQLQKGFAVLGGQRGQERTPDRAGMHVKGRQDKLMTPGRERNLDHVPGPLGVPGDLPSGLHAGELMGKP